LTLTAELEFEKVFCTGHSTFILHNILRF
jgi:hypothetical protein